MNMICSFEKLSPHEMHKIDMLILNYFSYTFSLSLLGI